MSGADDTSICGVTSAITHTSGSTSVNGWPDKKADYELEDAIGVGATATVYKVFLDSYRNS